MAKGRSKTWRVTVELGPTLPFCEDPADVQSFESTWAQLSSFFQRRRYLGGWISIDASDAFEAQRLWSARDRRSRRHLKERIDSLVARGRSLGGADLVLTLGGSSRWPENLVARFLEDLYLAMNISFPGSLSLLGASFDGRHLPSNPRVGKLAGMESKTGFDLAGDPLELARSYASRRSWPALTALSLEQTWAWLESGGYFELDIAQEPWHRLLFALLRVGYTQHHEADVILFAVQALEGLAGNNIPASLIQRRLEGVLGKPPTHQNWFKPLHATRSQLAHGAAQILRPGRLLDSDVATNEVFLSYDEQLDTSRAVLLAVVQKLVIGNARGLKCEETVSLT